MERLTFEKALRDLESSRHCLPIIIDAKSDEIAFSCFRTEGKIPQFLFDRYKNFEVIEQRFDFMVGCAVFVITELS